MPFMVKDPKVCTLFVVVALATQERAALDLNQKRKWQQHMKKDRLTVKQIMETF